ncbi:MAG: hypothetical protein JW990_13970 [Thermoleophilia bacterium]|nr:hypothetical protein [Thermoleophilia bacterium]
MKSGGRICIVTGERGSGKSTTCARVADGAAARGFRVSGILTERVELGPDSFRQVVDLATEERRAFGSQQADRGTGLNRDRVGERALSVSAISDPLTPGWRYESDVFDWANEVFCRSVSCDLLVIDEIGPLELLGGRGWVKALDALAADLFRLALVVCRPGLLIQLSDRLGGAAMTLLEVTPETRERLPGVILHGLSTTPACGSREEFDNQCHRNIMALESQEARRITPEDR